MSGSGGQADARITQFLKQGDEAFARGNAQEAIDLWSRVFLIDLSNEEASRRIDSAREAQAETARKIDMLLSEGVQSYEAGDLAGARNKFLDVLALSEHDATARGYLNQIEAALSTPGAGGAPASTSTPDSDFMRNEIEAPHAPSFADDVSPLEDGMSASGLHPGARDAPEGQEPRRPARPPRRRASCSSPSSAAGRTGSCAETARRPRRPPAPAPRRPAALPGPPTTRS